MRRDVKLLERFAKLVEDPKYVSNLEVRMREGTIHHSLEGLIWQYLLEKPKQSVQHVVEVVAKRQQELAEMSDDELRQSGARLLDRLAGLTDTKAGPSVH